MHSLMAQVLGGLVIIALFIGVPVGMVIMDGRKRRQAELGQKPGGVTEEPAGQIAGRVDTSP